MHCPVPLQHERIQLAHGGGGRLSRQLIDQVLRPRLDNAALADRTDSAVLPIASHFSRKVALTTDSYVVTPAVFPGGDIGRLAVCGTVNDLAMVGAQPAHLSLALILEEGLELSLLERIIDSVAAAARECGVSVVTGDTKVVDKGRADQLYINTAGVGWLSSHPARPGAESRFHPEAIQPGAHLIVSGDLGRHGIAVMSVREGASFSTDIESDVAPVHGQVQALIDSGVRIQCLRDLTRGGLAAAANELAGDSQTQFCFEEQQIPLHEQVAAVSELLGLSPYLLPNEGRFLAVVHADDSPQALAALNDSGAPGARVVGRVSPKTRDIGLVTLQNCFGLERVLDLPLGDQLPRIC